MGRLSSQPLILAAVAGVCAGFLPLLSQDEPIRVNVRLVRMLATVKDRTGRIIPNLSKSDFQITDNGVPQTITLFERETSQPLSIAMLVDNSGSTGREVKYEIDAVNRFCRTLFGSGNPEDALGLYSFNWEVRQETTFTRNLRQLSDKLRLLRFEAGTSMYDAIYFASHDLRSREGRHVMVIVTDGGDTTSSISYQNAVEEIQRADAVVYPVLVVPIKNEAGRNMGGENALTTISQQTGGRMFRPSAGPELDRAFDDILRDLRTQYLIGYYATDVPPSRERFHKTILKTSSPELQVSARSGYYEEAEESRPNRRGYRPARPPY